MKLTTDHHSDWPEALLHEFARDTLQARRCSAGYLPALRYVLGNMARADRTGALLEMNTTTPIGSEQTMRTILDQLTEQGITFRKHCSNGPGRKLQPVSFYRGTRGPIADLEQMYRDVEARDDDRRELAQRSWDGLKEAVQKLQSRWRLSATGIHEQDVPH